jgi:hypothetical protein
MAQVFLDHGGDARFNVLAVGCDEVLAESDPLTSVAGLDGGRLRFVMEAEGEFVGVRVGFHRFEYGPVVIRGGVIDPEVTCFSEGEDRYRHRSAQLFGSTREPDCASVELQGERRPWRSDFLLHRKYRRTLGVLYRQRVAGPASDR